MKFRRGKQRHAQAVATVAVATAAMLEAGRLAEEARTLAEKWQARAYAAEAACRDVRNFLKGLEARDAPLIGLTVQVERLDALLAAVENNERGNGGG